MEKKDFISLLKKNFKQTFLEKNFMMHYSVGLACYVLLETYIDINSYLENVLGTFS